MCGLILRSVGIVCGGLGNPAAILIVLWTVFDLVVWVYFRVYYCTLVRKLRSSTVEVCQITVYLWSSTWGIFNLYLLNIPGDWTVTVYYGIPCLCTLVWKWGNTPVWCWCARFSSYAEFRKLSSAIWKKGFLVLCLCKIFFATLWPVIYLMI